VRIQIGMFRPIRVDHTNCLQVAIKTHSFIQDTEQQDKLAFTMAIDPFLEDPMATPPACGVQI
jgi:hypothetical protein